MAKFTDVANGGLKAGITKDLIEWYVNSVEKFAKGYANKTTITFEADAEKWEGRVTNGNYRLDFQGANNGYGNIQAQFGKGQKDGGSFGGVLLACGVTFSVENVQNGLRRSLESKVPILVMLDADEEPVDIVPPSGKARFKNKPGKAPWTLDTVYPNK